MNDASEKIKEAQERLEDAVAEAVVSFQQETLLFVEGFDMESCAHLRGLVRDTIILTDIKARVEPCAHTKSEYVDKELDIASVDMEAHKALGGTIQLRRCITCGYVFPLEYRG